MTRQSSTPGKAKTGERRRSRSPAPEGPRAARTLIEAGNAAGEVEGDFATARDVTDQKQVQTALLRPEELLETIFSITHVLMAYLDTDFNFLRVNRAYAEADGRHPDDFVGKNHFDLYPHPENEAIFQRTLETGLPYTVHAKPFVYPADPGRGVTYWDWTLQPVLGAEGKVRGLLLSLIDVTKSALAADKARSLAAIVASSEDAIIGKDLDGTIRSWNRGAERMYGFSAGEAIGRSISLVIPPERADDLEIVLGRIRRGEIVEHFETVRRHKSGWLIDVSVTVSPIRDESGKVVGASSIARDNTERKRMVAELQAVSFYSRSLIEASLDPLVTISPAGLITDVNGATEQVTGRNRAQLVGTDFSEYFTEPEQARAGYRAVLDQGEVRDYPLTIRHRSGRTTDVVYNASVYRNPAGEIQGVFAAARDVTVRKRLEAELQATSLYTRSLIEASLDPLVTISPDGRITDVNRATEVATGHSRAELIGTDFSDYFTEPEQARAGYQAVLARGQVRDYPLTMRHASGQTTDVLYNASVYRNPAGGIQGVFAAARDMTERQRAEAERAQRLREEAARAEAERGRAELQAANQELESFSYSVSHDLRAPLRAIDGFSRILLDEHATELSAGAQEYLNLVRANTHQMGRLIDDLLTFSRLSRQPLSKQDVQPADIVRQALADLKTEQEGRTLEIVIGDLPPCAADPALLRQVWFNLLSNALKFTRHRETPRIEVGGGLQSGEPTYFVRDNGVGFDMRFVDKLFGVFQRLHPTEEYEGTGVGLATVQRIVHRHGGRVWAEGEVGMGAAFHFTLP